MNTDIYNKIGVSNNDNDLLLKIICHTTLKVPGTLVMKSITEYRRMNYCCLYAGTRRTVILGSRSTSRSPVDYCSLERIQFFLSQFLTARDAQHIVELEIFR